MFLANEIQAGSGMSLRRSLSRVTAVVNLLQSLRNGCRKVRQKLLLFKEGCSYMEGLINFAKV